MRDCVRSGGVLTTASACPLRAGVPIEASGIIPISQNDVAGIPALALSIPDFEGQAILRIFSNSTQTEIGCFSAVVTNGNSFSQPEWVASILGVFTFVALISSFATAIYGDDIIEMRKHYAHSLSVMVVFAVWQHIYFSGALSMNWPSVLVAFWSNYAWAGGMIYTETMQNTISGFIGSNKGNTTAVGAAGTGIANPQLGGGYDIHKIYKRNVFPNALNIPGLIRQHKINRVARRLEETLSKRELVDSADGFSWYGDPVKPGIPLPGNYSGFAGTLAQDNIPASNAFMTGFLWFLVLIAVIAWSVVAFKFTLEALSRTKLIKRDRLAYFRAHYLGYTALAVLRTIFIGFFAIMFLTLFQFTYLASPAPVAVASIVFLLMLIGLGGLAGYACFYRIKFGTYISEPDSLNIRRTKVRRVIPWFSFDRNSEFPRSEDKAYAGSLPWWRVHPADEMQSIHNDKDFTKKFGWLASRFRRTRWWFFVVWLVYDLIRACFLAGASGEPMVQVFGLLVVEFIAFIGIMMIRPFEGQRLNVIVVYLLGFSKVATVALSAAFDTRFAIPRIAATVVGIVIIVIQGVLTIIVLVAIVVGAITSYMSVMRNRDTIHPKRWIPIREKYFKGMDFKVQDIPRPPPTPVEPKAESLLAPALPKGPYFSVNSIRRVAKVEDEDQEFMSEIVGDLSTAQLLLSQQNPEGGDGIPMQRSGAPSIRSQMSYTSLPHGARVHRASWSSHEFGDYYAAGRRRTLSNPLTTPTAGNGSAGRNLSTPNRQFAGSSEYVARQPSPLSTSQPVTPPGSAGRGSDSPSPVPRPKNRPSSRSMGGSRPPLRTVFSQDQLSATHLPASKGTNEAASPEDRI